MNTKVFPKINFWSHNAPKLQIINPEDFRQNKLISAMGLEESSLASTFGISDRDEIIKRQKILDFLMKNHHFAIYLRNNKANFEIPMNSQEFLDYFDPRKKKKNFWGYIDGLLNALAKTPNLPDEIKTFYLHLKSIKDDTQKMEMEFYRRFKEKISAAACFDGFFDFTMEKGIFNLKVFGYKKYFFGPSEKRRLLEIENKMSDCFFLPVVKLIFSLMNYYKKKKYYTPMVIDDLPYDVKTDIQHRVRGIIKDALSDENGSTRNIFQLYFCFHGDNLKISLLNVTPGNDIFQEYSRGSYIHNYFSDATMFPGYSPKKLKELQNELKKANALKKNMKTMSSAHEDMAQIIKKMPELMSDSVTIESSTISKYYQWYSIPALIETSEFKSDFDYLTQIRQFVKSAIFQLRSVSDLAEMILKKSKELNIPLCFPEIYNDDTHLVNFKKLFPIHLIGENRRNGETISVKDLRPVISIAPLNGQMIGFTGQNAGGKSTAKEAIANAIFIAQSGLPVFGEQLALNVKNKLGVVFLDRGKGSTCELLLEKNMKILESVVGAKKNGVVFVIDEIGTGTQELGGLKYGKKFLSALAESKCSVIFSTQITELAEFAKDNLKAECFSFDMDHRIEPGIGLGNIEGLMKKIGIDKYLPV